MKVITLREKICLDLSKVVLSASSIKLEGLEALHICNNVPVASMETLAAKLHAYKTFTIHFCLLAWEPQATQ
jgi:hypothetical protein